MTKATANEIAAAATVVLGTTLSAVQLAAQCAPVPGLAPAIQAVISIMQTCDKIRLNKSEVQFLQKRCGVLVQAISDPRYINSKSADSLTKISEKATIHLKEVQALLDKHARHTFLGFFFKQLQICEDIETCHRELDNCYTEFDIAVNLQIRQWQEEHSKAYRQDCDELTRTLKHLDQNDIQLKESLGEANNKIDGVIRLLQIDLRKLDKGHPGHDNIQRSLYNVCKRFQELPTEIDITTEVRRIGRLPVVIGALFDIYEGIWLDQEKVAMKTVRQAQAKPNARMRLMREIEIWRKLWNLDKGKYILPLYGVYNDEGPFPYMVSPWMENGTIMDYLEKYPSFNRVELLKGIAEALRFLHGLEPPIAHGDIKGANILMNDSAQPILADFGLAKMIEGITGVPFTQSRGTSASYRWYPPEFCTPPAVISTHTDVFAFAMTIIQVITMDVPYNHIKLTIHVLLKMQKGERPNRPEEMNDLLWEVCNACWRHTPSERPSMGWVVERLESPD